MVDAAIVIVGAGEAGVVAAAALRDGGYADRIVLIDVDPQDPYERPPLSKELLLGTEDGPRLIRPAEWYADQKIELRKGCWVESVDAARQELSLRDAGGASETLAYSKLLLTTGASVRKLPGDPDGILYLRTYEDSMRMRPVLEKATRAVVIGGGVIGLEVASAARAMGVDVTVVDIAPRLMMRALAPEVSDLLRDLHVDAGVEVINNCQSVSVESADCSTLVRLGSGEELEADVVLAGIGVVPNVELAQAAGCAIENGILVDSCGRTSVTNIYAAGDAACFPHPLFDCHMRVEAWQHAGRHGAHVARSMLGQEDDYQEMPWFWTDQHGTNLQVAGIAAQCDETIWRGEGDQRTAFHFSGGKLVAATTINNGRDIRPATKLISAQWDGPKEALADASVPLRKIANAVPAG